MLDVSKRNDIGKKIRQSQAQLLLNTVENVGICKKTYQSLYKHIQLKIYQLLNTQRLEITLLDKAIGKNMHLLSLIVG